MSSFHHQADVPSLVDALIDQARKSTERFLLGITGPPGSGKSSLAGRVVDAALGSGVGAITAPMDGFHRSNEELTALGLLPLKGIPATFDAVEFVQHLRRVRSGADVDWPTFDRATDSVICGGARMTRSHRLVVVEGNYLLLEGAPWKAVLPLLDRVWYLDVPDHELEARLLDRHGRYRSPFAAYRKVQSTDLPNARLVATTMGRADVILRS